MPDEFQERTERATPKRRQDARKKGNVAKSQELNSAILILMGILILYLAGSFIGKRVANLSEFIFYNAPQISITKENVIKYTITVFQFYAVTVLPFVLMLMLIGVASNIAQVGFLFAPEALKPKQGKFNPISGIKRIMFSRRSLFELGKGIFKIAVVGIVAYISIKGLMNDVLMLMDSDPARISGIMARSGLSLGLRTGLAYLIISAIDFAFQRWQYERDLMMTRQEVKEETKDLEGDPLVRSRIRKKQREMVYNIMAQVPKADVVITNPTHIAVALKYEPEKMNAPKVIAKGMNLIAERIKQIARDHGVPIVEDKPLAQMLFKLVNINEEIPPQLYRAVAKVLAYVFQLKETNRRV
jgi:flagellar biosynthetic protein FlhB